MEKKCYVISPIGSEGSDIRIKSDKVLKYIIRPAIESIGYSVQRADEAVEAGSISKSIIQNVLTSDLLIADLTNNNPNVFYELAIRHATGKPFIQIIEKDQKIPFDIFDIRTITYDLDLDSVESAKNNIQNFAKSFNGTEKVKTPITEILSILETPVPNNGSDFSNLFISTLQRIDDSIQSLKYELLGRIDYLRNIDSVKNELTKEEKMGIMFLEKMLEDPGKSEDMIQVLTKLKDFK